MIPLAFGCVYLFWGSTYLAIKIGGRDLPAFLLTGVRFLISGTLMLVYCRLRGLKTVRSARELAWLALYGLLLLGIGNASLVWGEKYLASGFASLLTAVVPLYVAAIETFLPGGEPLPPRGWLGLALGFLGLAALLAPSVRHGLSGQRGPMLAVAVLLLGALAWTIGSILSRRVALPVHSLVAAGWEMLFAGLINTVAATLLGDWSHAHWTLSSAGAIAYLVVFGSLVGFTAYVWLLEHVPVAKLATYAYVNPVVAVALGALFLGERLDRTEYAGMLAVIFAVFLVTSSQVKSRPAQECSAVEAIAAPEP